MFYPSLASANLPIEILKLGGSVLSGTDALPVAVAEVKRTLANGFRIVVVTSAFSGVTERLLGKARDRFRAPADRPLASLLATGESRAAAFVSLALDDAGIDNALLDPDRVRFVVHGTWLDGEPAEIDVTVMHDALARAPVVVFPGFYGRRADGSVALLGRGGSDLTALFLAEQLGAEACRLVKNVDGLFEHDPATAGGSELRRYDAATWDEVASLGGGLVQRKAIDFARRHRIAFTISAPSSSEGTRVGSAEEVVT